MVDLIAQGRVAQLVQAGELIETQRAPVRQDQSMEGNRQARFAKRLHRFRLTQHVRSGGDQHVLRVLSASSC